MKPQKKKDDSNYTVKIVIVGDSGVGKTNIICRFCDNNFKSTYVSTIGVDFKNKIINVDDVKIKLQIWDTAGQERFQNINQTYFKGAMAVLLAYSINDYKSFQNIQNWIKQIKEHTDADIIMFLVGNKCDLPDRKVSIEEGREMANRYRMDFMEISAKDGINIQSTFNKMGEKVYQFLKKNQNFAPIGSQKPISLHKKEDLKRDEGRCKC